MQSKVGQTSNISTHHIHCKYPGNIYSQAILSVYTSEGRSKKQHQHSAYSSKDQHQYLLTGYFVHAHRANQVKKITSASTTFVANILEMSTYIALCANDDNSNHQQE